MKTFVSINQRSGGRTTPLACALALLTVAAVQAQPLLITTVAGYAGKGSADGTSNTALFYNPQGVAVNAAGTVYVADTGNNTIRAITSSGVSSTLAGRVGVSGSADGANSNAFFNQPSGIALDSAGNIYVTDYGNDTIRKVSPAGAVVTIAGSAGVAGSVNNTGTNALFFHPLGIAVDSNTNLYVADYGNQLIRKISPTYAVTTLAGQAGVFGTNNGNGTAAQFYNPEGVTLDNSGNVYVADTGNAAVRMITSGGMVSALAGSPGSLGSTDGSGSGALFYQPSAIVYSSANNLLYVADYFNNTIRQVSTGGTVMTVAGLAGTTGSADGASSSARFWAPQGLAAATSGSIYIADTGNSTIRTMTAAGVVNTFAGSPSAGSANGATSISRFYSPQNLAVDNSSNIYVADTQNSIIRKITLTGTVSILAGSVGTAGSQDGNGPGALFSGPQGIAVDSGGNVYVADTGNSTIREITPGGASSTVAGLAGQPGVQDGSGTNAQFNNPEGIAVDSSGNIYVADTWNHTIREISGGASTTLAGEAGVFGSFDGTNSAARFNCPTGLAVDGSDNLYVCDYNNDTIRKVAPGGVVTTVAGTAGIWGSADGTNGNASFLQPAGIGVDSSDNLYVVDSGNHTLRKITSSGGNWIVSTIAGAAGLSGSTDGTGTAAEFYYPSGVASAGGYVYVADTGNNTIRSQGIPPNIITQPQSQTNLAGTLTTFTVSASGSMPFTYIWQYNTTNLAPSSSPSLIASNAGTYLVVVSNVAGTMTSSAATLTLTNPPTGAAGVFQSYVVQPNGSVLFNLTGTSGSTYSLIVSTNLTTWSNLMTFVMTNGAVQISDTTAANFPTRFYMLVSP